MTRNKQAYTPMIRQYLEIKDDYPDAFLFFRLGDFYELFFEDAILAAKELEITLTARATKGAAEEDKIPMCGVPHHAAEGYIDKLLAKGYKVAICEQLEDASEAKGMVKRGVTNVLTPGTLTRGSVLDAKANHYLVALEEADNIVALVYADLSTGGAFATTVPKDELISKLIALDVKEIVIGEDFDTAELQKLTQLTGIVTSICNETAVPLITEVLAKNILDANVYTAFGRLTNYIQQTQASALETLQTVALREENQYMKLDYHSQTNLELTETIRKKTRHGSLLWLLDKTETAMGSRLLRQFILNPLTDIAKINSRLTHVEAFASDLMQLETFKRALRDVYDLERLIGRVASGSANGRDLLQLKNSLQKLPEVEALIGSFLATLNTSVSFHDLSDIAEKLENAIDENVPVTITEGNIFKDGYSEKLDEYRHVMRHGKDWLIELEEKERERSGINSLKVKYNKVFGYFIEVTSANLHLVTEDLGYIRKQTLANCERYITDELKEKEDIILNASDLSVELEYELFVELRDELKNYVRQVQENATKIAYFDVIGSLAHVASEYGYVKPQVTTNRTLEIEEGRHPVIERVLKDELYVPNDCVMAGDLSVFLITGPNMSGKSTYMRQVALICLMAQMGSFVPAVSATIPVFDQIFTRIGAGDDLTSGHSTFMVEMIETNYALTNASKNSLILLDEIGRGTATFDGMALAQGIIEYIHENIGAKTLFATHYHELTALEEQLSGLENLHVRAKEHDGNLIFMHKVSAGASDRSYGVHVARIAGLPDGVVERARELLIKFERDGTRSITQETISESMKIPTKVRSQNQEVIDKLQALNVNELRPIEALNILAELKEELE